jgi:UDP-N-acetylmuramyl tripeptide synthase
MRRTHTDVVGDPPSSPCQAGHEGLPGVLPATALPTVTSSGPFRRIRLTAVLVSAKVAGRASRLLRRGDGQALPGMVAQALMPEVASVLSQQFGQGVIIVTGTNGKTTTTKLLVEMLTAAGQRVVSNRSGSNMKQGIVSSLIDGASLWGVLRRAPTIGVFEVDEATVPLIVDAIGVTDVVVTNLFRDQLDRYGDLDSVAQTIGRALGQSGARVYLNADDPMVASLSGYVQPHLVTYFGVQRYAAAAAALQTAVDSAHCPQCGSRLRFDLRFYSHLGHYRCPAGHFSRPNPTVRVCDVVRADAHGSVFSVQIHEQELVAQVKLGGLYNLYNALAALAVAQGVGVPVTVALQSLTTAAPAFGRVEEIKCDGRLFKLILVKNPAGFTQVLETFLRHRSGCSIVIGVDDLDADGRDVSWLWDVPLECLAGRGHHIAAAGSRAHDVGLRLHYGGIESVVIQDISSALDDARGHLRPGETGYVLTTYTAMYGARRHLRNMVFRKVLR